MALSGKVVTLDTQLLLVREYQVAWLELVDFDGSSIVVLSARVSSGSAILFTKMVRGAMRRFYSGRPKLDTEVTDDSGPAKTLTVLEPQMPPVSVLRENILFM